MAVKMARERYLWLLQVDWPVHLRTKAWGYAMAPNQTIPPVTTIPKSNYTKMRPPNFDQNLKKAAREFEDWLDQYIGSDNWAIEYSEVQDDHDLMSNMDYEAFVIRVKTEEEAVLVQMRWS
jgi:hypothetical protein